MSTNINITVGDKGLLDRIKQEQAAKRQAQLNREALAQVEAQAIAARTAAFAAQGRDPDGNLITNAFFPRPQIERRPIANRGLSSSEDSSTVTLVFTLVQGIAIPVEDGFINGTRTYTETVQGNAENYFLLVEVSPDNLDLRNPIGLLVYEAAMDLSSGVPVFSGYSYRGGGNVASYTATSPDGAQIIYEPLEGWPEPPT
jgi:hypothetical protein